MHLINEEIMISNIDYLKIYTITKIKDFVLEITLRCLDWLKTRSYFNISADTSKDICFLGRELRYLDWLRTRFYLNLIFKKVTYISNVWNSLVFNISWIGNFKCSCYLFKCCPWLSKDPFSFLVLIWPHNIYPFRKEIIRLLPRVKSIAWLYLQKWRIYLLIRWFTYQCHNFICQKTTLKFW